VARRNGFLDAIQSFNAAYDTVEKVGKGFEQARAMRETPQESRGYTTNDGEMLRNIAEARDAEGNLAYQLEARPDNTYGLKVRGQDGTYTPVDGPGIAAGAVTDFMGKRTAGSLDQSQIDRARYSKIADIEAKYDPRAALQMRRELVNQDREDQRFNWEQQAQPMKLRSAELGLKSGERTERQGERGDMIQQLDDAVAQMPRDALEVYASKLNTNDSPYPMLYTGQTKDGFKFVTTDPATGKPSGKEFVLNEAQLRQMASASVLGMAGYGQESIARLSSVNKEMADHIKTWNDAISKSTASENDALYKGGQLAVAHQNADTNEAYRRQMATAAAARASGAGGGKGVDAIWSKAEEVAKAGHYGGNVERAYSALKRGQDRGGVQEEATKLEIKLREAGQPEAAIQQQLGAFLVARGLPPASEVARLRSGVGPDGKPLTAEDYASWDRRFPGMPAEDVLGSSPVPSREQLDIIRRDAEANGIKNPTFAWDAGGRTTKGSVQTSTPTASGLPSRMTKPAGNQQADTPEGAQLDAARAELADLRKSAPGLKAGLAAREEYAQLLKEKQAAVRQAEQQYQRSLAVPLGPYLGLGANSR